MGTVITLVYPLTVNYLGQLCVQDVKPAGQLCPHCKALRYRPNDSKIWLHLHPGAGLRTKEEQIEQFAWVHGVSKSLATDLILDQSSPFGKKIV